LLFFAVLLAFALLQVDFASAAAPTDWVTPVETAVKAEAGNVTKVMLALLVIGLGIFGLQWGVRKAIRFFKATTN